MPVDPDLIDRIFEWNSCEKNCKTKLKALIAEWPQGESPSQLINSDGLKLGTEAASLSEYNNNYDILVHVHNADSVGRELDPTKKWGKLFNMGGIPGVGIGARISRGVSSAIMGGRRTRRRKNKKNKNKKSRRKH